MTTTQLTLPRQSHTADGPHDQTGMYVMHHALRRDLVDFTSAVRRTPLYAADTWQALRRRWARFAAELHHHHGAEDDLFWPALLESVRRRGDDGDRAEVAAMEDEHAAIDPAVTRCAEGFAAMANGPDEDLRRDLLADLGTLHDGLEAHLRHEESVVLPMIQRVMTDEEFTTAEQAVARSHPMRTASFTVPWAMSGLSDEGRERMFALAGAPYRVIYALSRRRFARRERAAFRYRGHDDAHRAPAADRR
ncbi:hemerythrin domain-containing protein [Gordonia sp. (in: high G+C Gram-positive bacteria)]|uniref:hemerythrin domain-containing protein n=1 Tax=Gordonia sp. (in: high G+C Gram-positive bacteria) TaxID=84139 RepID=UPI0039E42399